MYKHAFIELYGLGLQALYKYDISLKQKKNECMHMYVYDIRKTYVSAESSVFNSFNNCWQNPLFI